MKTFFDFCSGIGGGRVGLENNNLICVGHSEIDEKAIKTYNIFFNDDRNYGDLTKLDHNILPEFDLMIAGFPCQTFSIVGKRKGFEDERGKIIYSLINILKKKRTKYFILENVKGLISHDRGQTFRIIRESLVEAGYDIFYKVLNSIDYGVPQSRERVYIVGFRQDLKIESFRFPDPIVGDYIFDDFIDSKNTLEFDISDNNTFIKYLYNKYNNGKYSVEDILSWNNKVIDWRQSDIRIYDRFFPTLRTGRHGLLYIKDGVVKKISGCEGLLIQGFGRHLAKKAKSSAIKDNVLLSQAGNAMTVNVIDKIAKEMLKAINGECRV